MSTIKENIKVTDKNGFNYEVNIEHQPYHGFTSALYNGIIIGQCQLGRILEPTSDDDREWEIYEESLEDWKCAIKTNITKQCENYFNQ